MFTKIRRTCVRIVGVGGTLSSTSTESVSVVAVPMWSRLRKPVTADEDGEADLEWKAEHLC